MTRPCKICGKDMKIGKIYRWLADKASRIIGIYSFCPAMDHNYEETL